MARRVIRCCAQNSVAIGNTADIEACAAMASSDANDPKATVPVQCHEFSSPPATSLKGTKKEKMRHSNCRRFLDPAAGSNACG
jgi:hypothetical protein